MSAASVSEKTVHDLSSALADTAAKFLMCRDERAVLELAISSLRPQGGRIGCLLGDEEGLRFAPFALSVECRLSLEETFGVSLRDLVLSPTEHRILGEILEAPGPIALAGRPGAEVLLELVASPTERARAGAYAMGLTVGDRTFGILLAESEALSPATASILALFGRNVAAALENVRHRAEASKRLEELTRLQEELVSRERLAALGGAAGLVAHEVRNPLGAILNAATLLKRNPQGNTADLLDMIEEEAFRIDGLVRDLLELARPLDPGLRPVGLASIVEDAVEQLGERLGEAAVELELAPVCSRQVAVDPELVQMAVTHLLRNALDASRPGDRVQVLVGGAGGHGGFISVIDEGVGIPEKARERIFEPFFTTRAKGRGLGLVLAKRVVDVHQGTIEMVPRPTGGTSVTIRFPGVAPTS